MGHPGQCSSPLSPRGIRTRIPYQQLTQTFMLDPEMRDRLARLNPTASARVANRLLEASERKYWQPDAQMLDALRKASEELEDRLEGVYEGVSP